MIEQNEPQTQPAEHHDGSIDLTGQGNPQTTPEAAERVRIVADLRMRS